MKHSFFWDVVGSFLDKLNRTRRRLLQPSTEASTQPVGNTWNGDFSGGQKGTRVSRDEAT